MPAEEQAKASEKIVFVASDGTTREFPPVVVVFTTRAIEVVDSVHKVEEIYRVCMECFGEFSREIISSADRMRYAWRVDNGEAFNDRLRINQLLTSLFTVLRMYSESIRRLFDQSSELVDRLFSMPGFWELDVLRNYVQHVSFLPLRGSLQYTLCDPDVALVAVRYELSNDEFRLDELRPGTREKLEHLLNKGEIDLCALVQDGMAAFRIIHEIVRRTRYFDSEYSACERYLKRMYDLTVAGSYMTYQLCLGEKVFASGNAYFYTTQMARVKEMRAMFPTQAPYPPNKSFPTFAPTFFIDRYKAAYPMSEWVNKSDEYMKRQETLLRDYSLATALDGNDLTGIERVQKALDAVLFTEQFCDLPKYIDGVAV